MEQASIYLLAAVLMVFCTPLFLDLAICIAGNLARPRRPSASSPRSIHLAVVVPAHDEELLIARTVQSLKAADAATPVYVVAHNCLDNTAALAQQAGASVLVLSNPRLRGKGAALRHGFGMAIREGANAVMVVDADSIVSSNLVDATRTALANGADATQCRYELELTGGGSGSPLARLRALAFRGMNVLRARGRAGWGLSTGIFGNGFALTEETLDRVPFDADSIAEDVEYHTRLVGAGVSVCWVGEAFVHAHLPASGEARASQESRWEGGRFRVASRATGRLLDALLHGKLPALETLLDVWSLPVARGILGLILTFTLPVPWLHGFAWICAGVVILYAVQAALLGGEPVRDLTALAAAPLYLVWKALITPLVLRQSRGRAEWARTKREASQS